MPQQSNSTQQYLVIEGVGTTHTGYYRERNEDRYGIFEDVGLAFVADGMGGLMNGDVASMIAAQCVVRAVTRVAAEGDGVDVRSIFESIVEDARLRMIDYQHTEDGDAELGTTLTVAWLRPDDRLHILHIGDSRAYLVRGGSLVPITRDHSVVGEMVDRGELTREEARLHPYSNAITRYLDGSWMPLEPDLYAVDVRAGDRVVLCTDGLTDMVAERRIEELCGEAMTRHELIDALLTEALEAGGYDNITIVVLDVTRGDAARPGGEAGTVERQTVPGIERATASPLSQRPGQEGVR